MRYYLLFMYNLTQNQMVININNLEMRKVSTFLDDVVVGK